MGLAQAGKLRESVLIAERHKRYSMMGEGRHRSDGGGLLPSAKAGGRDKEAGRFAVESA